MNNSFFASIKGTLHKDNSSNKLRSYCKFKTTYTFENYLVVKTDKTSISKYAKLRISNHRLNKYWDGMLRPQFI